MEQNDGILILVKRGTDNGRFAVAFGVRSHDDTPDISCAVGDLDFLEILGLKNIGDQNTITNDHVFKEWLIGAPFHQVIQELGDADSGFEVMPENVLRSAWGLRGLGKGIRVVWRNKADISWFLLLYDSASYRGGRNTDDNTFGSNFYVLAAFNSGLLRKTPKLTDEAAYQTELVVDDTAESVWLQRLAARYPDIANKLISRVRSGGVISGEIDNVARNIWWLGQLWLVFLDGDDFGLTDDREIYDNIKQLAAKRPRWSIEEEASAWMQERAANMSKFEIEMGLDCAVKSAGTMLILNGNYDGTYKELVGGRHRHDISD